MSQRHVIRWLQDSRAYARKGTPKYSPAGTVLPAPPLDMTSRMHGGGYAVGLNPLVMSHRFRRQLPYHSRRSQW